MLGSCKGGCTNPLTCNLKALKPREEEVKRLYHPMTNQSEVDAQ